MPSTWKGIRSPWITRIERAAELAERNPWAAEPLLFYKRILQFQKGVSDRSRGQNNSTQESAASLRQAIDVEEAARELPELVLLVGMYGPAQLAEDASMLRGADPASVQGRLKRFLNEADPSCDNSSFFFARILLEPQAERLAQARVPPQEGLAGNRCPYCDSRPQLAAIRPEGDGGKRMLLCSLCQSEWDFRRVLCPACGETNHERLPRYTADGVPAVRVESCDTCKSYLKSVDMTIDGRAVPVVDEIATAPLDLWAAEHDYRKIQLNLMGF